MSSQTTTGKTFLPPAGRLLRWALILGIWAFIAILSPLLAQGQPMAIYFVAALAILPGAYVLLRWPGIGFPMLVVSSLLVPLKISTGTQTSINSSLMLVVGLIALWVFEMVGRDRTIHLVKSPVILPALLFSLVSILAFFFGQLNWFPSRAASLFAQLGELMILLLSVGTLILTIHRLQDIIWLKWAVWLFILLGSAYAIGFMVPFTRHIVNRVFQRAVQDSTFWTWLIVLAFSQALLNKDLGIPWRILSGVAAAASFYTVFVTKQSWTSGWFPAAAALFVVIFLYKPKWAIALAISGGVVYLIRAQLISNLVLAGDNSYSITTRLAAWKILWNIIKLNPVFGLGPANYYWYTPYFSILGYSVSFNSHNNYVDIVAQVGFLGLFCLLWLFVAIGRVGNWARKLELSGFEKAYVYGSLGGFVGTVLSGMLGDWFMPFVYNVGMDGFRAASLAWFFIGGMIFVYLRAKSASTANIDA